MYLKTEVLGPELGQGGDLREAERDFGWTPYFLHLPTPDFEQNVFVWCFFPVEKWGSLADMNGVFLSLVNFEGNSIHYIWYFLWDKVDHPVY